MNPKAACLKRRGDEEKMNDEVSEKRMNLSGSFDNTKRSSKKQQQQVRRQGTFCGNNYGIDFVLCFAVSLFILFPRGVSYD